MKNKNSQLMDRLTREAISSLQSKSDRNTGGMLLGKHMIAKSGKHYDRRAMKRNDRQDRREYC